jgi:hypothetical protein
MPSLDPPGDRRVITKHIADGLLQGFLRLLFQVDVVV